jgi:hypothetical protein
LRCDATSFGFNPDVLFNDFDYKYLYDHLLQSGKLNTVDVLLAHFPPGKTAELFRGYGKPMIVNMGIQFDNWDWRDVKLAGRRMSLLINNNTNTVVTSQSLFYTEQMDYFAGTGPLPLAEMYGWGLPKTERKYNPSLRRILFGQKKQFCSDQNVVQPLFNNWVSTKNFSIPYELVFAASTYRHTSFHPHELLNFGAIVGIPYTAIITVFVEYFTLGVPIFVPSIDFMTELQMENESCMYELMEPGGRYTANGDYKHASSRHPYSPYLFRDPKAFRYWLSFTWWYTNPYFRYFSSWNDLFEQLSRLDTNDLLQTSNNMLAQVEQRTQVLKKEWAEYIRKVTKDKEPGSFSVVGTEYIPS